MQLAQQPQKGLYEIENVDLSFSWFDGIESVGISAGASTPDNLIEDVIAKVKLFSKIKVKEEIYG